MEKVIRKYATASYPQHESGQELTEKPQTLNYEEQLEGFL